MVEVSVKVTGLRELATAFRRVDTELPRELKSRFLPIAQRVAGVVQQRMPIRSGRAAGSVGARATVRGASVVAGGRAAPYYQFLDFGGTTGRGHHPGGGGSVKRPFVKGGRYIYPAIAESRDDTAKAVDDAIEGAARAAGFVTREGF
jgi:hypothetical protein